MELAGAETAASTTTGSAGQGGKRHQLQTHIPALDGIRGFAAAAVAVGHFCVLMRLNFVDEQIGSYAVVLFFILSGFLMGHLYLGQPFNRERVQAYFAARISRIVPLYYAVGLASFLFSQFDSRFINFMTPIDGIRHIFMLNSVTVFWTIAPEFQFYFLFPVLWWIIHQPRRVRLPAGAIAVAVTAIAVAYRHHLPGLLVFSKLHIFLLGVGIAAVAPVFRARMPVAAVIGLQLVGIGILVCLMIPPTYEVRHWLYIENILIGNARFFNDIPRVLLMGLCVLPFAIADTRLARIVLGNAFARKLGKYSYSIYLLHAPVAYILIYRLQLHKVLPIYGCLAAAIMVTYLASAASFRWLEEPARIAGRRTLNRLFGSMRIASRPARQTLNT